MSLAKFAATAALLLPLLISPSLAPFAPCAPFRGHTQRILPTAGLASFDLQELEQRFLGPGGADWTKMEFTNDGKSVVIGTNGSGHFVLDAFSGEISHFCYRKSGHSGRLAPGATPDLLPTPPATMQSLGECR